jgi:hypothetical protein
MLACDFWQIVRGLINEYQRSGLTSLENTSSEPLCEFWHGTGSDG